MKKLTVLFSALMLIGCGGGGGSSGGSNTVASEKIFDGAEKAYSFELDLKNPDIDSDYSVSKTELYQKDGIVYAKAVSGEPEFSGFLVTESGLYEADTKTTYNASKGVRVAFVKSLNDTVKVTTPFNQAGHRDLEETTNTVVVDLKNKPIAPVISPKEAASAVAYGINSELTYNDLYLPYKLIKDNALFSAGAKCSRSVSYKYNTVHFAFDPADSSSIVKDAKTLTDWYNGLHASNSGVTPLETENYGGTNIGVIKILGSKPSDTQYLFAIEYKGKVYRVEPVNNTLVTYSNVLETLRTQWLADPEVTAEQIIYINTIVDSLKNDCDYFNEVAAKDIEKAIAKANS